jgi:hypothetical protein
MATRIEEPPLRSYDFLLKKIEDFSPGADIALGKYQKIRDAGGNPVIRYSTYHGWIITDLNAK